MEKGRFVPTYYVTFMSQSKILSLVYPTVYSIIIDKKAKYKIKHFCKRQ